MSLSLWLYEAALFVLFVVYVGLMYGVIGLAIAFKSMHKYLTPYRIVGCQELENTHIA